MKGCENNLGTISGSRERFQGICERQGLFRVNKLAVAQILTR
jgi:hypothetical protein